MIPIWQIVALVIFGMFVGGLANAMGRVMADASIWLSVKFVAWVKKMYFLWKYRRRMAREARMKLGIAEIVAKRQLCGEPYTTDDETVYCIKEKGHSGLHFTHLSQEHSWP